MQPRKDVVTPGAVAYYHCISRCVRRAFLCGKDEYSGKNFEHRRAWIRDRVTLLIEAFAMEVAAYAVLSGHMHSVVKTRPDLAHEWSAEEVARRWLIVFCKKLRIGDEEAHLQQQIEAIANDPEKVSKYRERLSNVSWFNRCLNENIARRANREDDVTGRFWEGRFKCQLLKDEKALLTCSVYVDLNIIRAGMAKTLETSDYTSIQDRIRNIVAEQHPEQLNSGPPLLSISSMFGSRVSFTEYLSLVDQTARVHVEGKASLSPDCESILTRLGISNETWVPTVTKRYSKMFRRIVGTEEQLREHALEKGKCWFQGITEAQSLFCSR